MELVIGGTAQGKLGYVLEKYPGATVLDFAQLLELSDIEEQMTGKVVLNHFHLLMKAALSDGKEPEEIRKIVSGWIMAHSDMVVICDEIGNGIVPMEREERRYREETGRMLCYLARSAERVERISCGIPLILKESR